MAEAKEKKVTERDKFMAEAAQMFMREMDLDFVYKTKEGLLFNRGEEQVAVKFIQKKSKVYQEDIVETIERLYDFAGEAVIEIADDSDDADDEFVEDEVVAV